MGKAGRKELELIVLDEGRGLLERIRVREEDIERSYRGRPGCMCGCRGTYSNKKSLGMRRLKKIIELCKEFNTVPRKILGLKGETIIYLPREVEQARNVNYTVYIRL